MLKYQPKLDANFKPMIIELREYKNLVKNANEKDHVAICVERENGYLYRYELDILKSNKKEDHDLNHDIVERIIKSILWVVGGFKIYLSAPSELAQSIKDDYSLKGSRNFDVDFMSKVYDAPFEVIITEYNALPKEKNSSIPVGGHLEGCRIGFDAGGSDRKVSAVVEGEVIYSEEVVWLPKVNTDPKYHFDGIVDSFKRAASKMPRVDAIGVSSAGIYINNEVRVASLFLKVPEDLFQKEVRNIYQRAALEIGNVPLVVVNDGDVTALAGALDLHDTNVLGIAMGTSEAVGYINKEGNINGWLSELAFVPVDFNKNAMVDEWSGDYGCGVKYFSQDSVIKLAENAGLSLDAETPAEKLKIVQKLMAANDPVAYQIYESIGYYLGYTIPYYAEFYDIKYLLLLGRVTSGMGGDIIIEKANEVIKNEFPEFANIKIMMPDEKSRRVGQSIAAASLPAIK